MTDWDHQDERPPDLTYSRLPTLPFFRGSVPLKIYESDQYIFATSKDVETNLEIYNKEKIELRYHYVMAVKDKETKSIIYYITLEERKAPYLFFCYFGTDGTHYNLGKWDGPVPADIDSFIVKAFEFLRKKLHITEGAYLVLNLVN
ncbi:MAG: hypothetical protein CMM50_09845 [Rhodospirillaceae bacterium]|nr:hypothetical protein [Rhodospirillaceae bacterium]|tara:strand:- start:82 stop:519 length:438 start_codon:yes stop_codon:yes gene_type:complete